MRSRRAVVVFAIVALMASVLLVTPAAGSPPAMACDHEYVKVHGSTIKVLPNGVDDTANLQCALDLASSMPWAKVKLIAGDYFTSFLEVADFNGVFKGAGRGNTNILSLPGGVDCVARFEAATNVFLLTFSGSDLLLKGFTVGIGGEAACAEPWVGFIDDDGFGFEDRSIDGIHVTHPREGEAACPAQPVEQRVRVYGIGVEAEFADTEEPFVDITGIAIGLLASRSDECDTQFVGDVVVRGSHFAGLDFMGLGIFNRRASSVVVGGPKPWHQNTFDDVGLGVYFGQSNSSRFLIRGNEVHDAHYWGVAAEAGEPDVVEPSTVTIVRNDIVGIQYADGVGVLDFGPDSVGHPLLDATVAYNTIDVTSEFNGVYALGADGRIIGNRISGAPFTGVFLDGLGYFDEETEEEVLIFSSNGWSIAKNRFHGLDPFAADIFLSYATDNNTVICRCGHDTVIDEGIDNHIVHCDVLPPEEPVDAVQSVGLTRVDRIEKYIPTTRRFRH